MGDEDDLELHRVEKRDVQTGDKNSPAMEWWRKAAEGRDARLQWWREARFGMFIHWGVYSELGGEWHGKPVSGYAEHIQRKLKIPGAVYRSEAVQHFNPVLFDADAWVKTAKAAGMGYLIITAKHHDGFAMYDSKVSSYNIVQATPFHRDPMRELRAACERYGMKFGFYYSHAFDWGEPNGVGNDWEYDNPGGDLLLHGGAKWWEESPQLLAKVRSYVDHKAIPQVVELITNYHPDILWFDTPHKLPPEENLRILKAVRAAGPNIVVNSRIVQPTEFGSYGDYKSTADRPAEFAPQTGDWEGIPTTNESYGYSKADTSHKPPAHFIQLLAKAAARGGNLLLNIGPRGDGTFDPKDVAILQGVGDWMKVNITSIRGTDRTPLPVQSWGESTRNNNTLYLHVFHWPGDGRLIVGGLKSQVKRAYLLASQPEQALVTERLNGNDLLVQVPNLAPDAVDSVVALEVEGTVETDPNRLILPTLANTLRVFDAQRQGKTLRFGAGKTQDATIQNWSNPAESVFWPVRLEHTARFEVSLVYDADAASAGSTYTVNLGAQTLRSIVAPGKTQSVNLGPVLLQEGTFHIEVKPLQIKGQELMRLRSLVLTPVQD